MSSHVLDAWFPAESATLESCGNVRRWSFAGESISLGVSLGGVLFLVKSKLIHNKTSLWVLICPLIILI